MKTSILVRGGNYKAPRSLGSSAVITQSAEAVGAVAVRQLPRLSSARANISASFGSFPDVSRMSRLSVQAIAKRCAGQPLPPHDHPETCKSGASKRLMKPRHDDAASVW